MTKAEPEKKGPIITIPDDLDAVYANLVRITHSPSEFIFDFAQMLPGLKGPTFKSRVLLSPMSAKLIYKALGDNLAKYETNFGEISIPGASSLADNLFTPPEE
ncbi:MAG: DUF3467 domain-containing protein [Anaerolineales bacterium]|nr:DUF3467 domain-containing protein [Anaerolineales bacterium]